MLILSLIIIILIIIESLSRFIFHRSKVREFYTYTDQDLDKFKNYDSELGWELKSRGLQLDSSHSKSNNKLNSNKKVKASYRINIDGSRSHPDYIRNKSFIKSNRSNNIDIEIFGDSCTFCREVEDDETFSFYLESIYGINSCKNFGVGNYGADQAYLRSRRKINGNGSIAILHFVINTLNRIDSVYKHYHEEGNTWAVKPRFTINNKSLELINRPFKSKSELKNLSNYAFHFHKYDNHWLEFRNRNKKDPETVLFSHLIYLLINHESLYIFFLNLKRLIIRKPLKSKRYKIVNNPKWPEIIVSKAKGKHGKLLALIARDFYKNAMESGCSDSFMVVLPQGIGVRNIEKYFKAIDELKSHFKKENLDLYDFGVVLNNLKNEDKTKAGVYKGHLSSYGNKLQAKWLYDIINERD